MAGRLPPPVGYGILGQKMVRGAWDPAAYSLLGSLRIGVPSVPRPQKTKGCFPPPPSAREVKSGVTAGPGGASGIDGEGFLSPSFCQHKGERAPRPRGPPLIPRCARRRRVPGARVSRRAKGGIANGGLRRLRGRLPFSHPNPRPRTGFSAPVPHDELLINRWEGERWKEIAPLAPHFPPLP